MQWTSYVGQLMLRRARGWLEDPTFFNAWDIHWLMARPRALLVAARRSPYPPCEIELQRWCALYYPDAISTLWPDPGDPTCLGLVQLHSMD